MGFFLGYISSIVTAISQTGDSFIAAGDFMKFNFPMAFATTTLLWGLIRFEDGYTTSGELDNMYNSVRWPLDYFLKCWDDQNDVYWAQVTVETHRLNMTGWIDGWMDGRTNGHTGG